MKWLNIYIVLLLFLLACKNDTVDLSGNEKIDMKALLQVFKPISLPVTIADTNMKKRVDTVAIGYKALQQFIPDSVLQANNFSKKNSSIHPVGKIEKKEELYLIVALAEKKKYSMYVFVFDKKNTYKALKKIIESNINDGYIHSVNINKEPTFSLIKEKLNSNKQLLFTRIGWAFNSEDAFMMVLNDSNEDVKKNNTVLNPIDTFPSVNKLSGEYIENTKNYMSIRDGKNAQHYLFFIHFEKKEGSCVGELKGELTLKDATHGIYTANGDPCIIDFTFNGNTVVLKEQGSCGNYRGIDCYFNDTFVKKKETKSKKKKV